MEKKLALNANNKMQIIYVFFVTIQPVKTVSMIMATICIEAILLLLIISYKCSHKQKITINPLIFTKISLGYHILKDPATNKWEMLNNTN